MSNSNYGIGLQRLKPVHTAYCGVHNLAENWSWARDVNGRDRDETETSASLDRDVETETTTLSQRRRKYDTRSAKCEDCVFRRQSCRCGDPLSNLILSTGAGSVT